MRRPLFRLKVLDVFLFLCREIPALFHSSGPYRFCGDHDIFEFSNPGFHLPDDLLRLPFFLKLQPQLLGQRVMLFDNDPKLAGGLLIQNEVNLAIAPDNILAAIAFNDSQL